MRRENLAPSVPQLPSAGKTATFISGHKEAKWDERQRKRARDCFARIVFRYRQRQLYSVEENSRNTKIHYWIKGDLRKKRRRKKKLLATIKLNNKSWQTGDYVTVNGLPAAIRVKFFQRYSVCLTHYGKGYFEFLCFPTMLALLLPPTVLFASRMWVGTPPFHPCD